jgi:hypothetical protein
LKHSRNISKKMRLLITILIFVSLLFLSNQECSVDNDCMWIGQTGKFCDRTTRKCQDFGVSQPGPINPLLNTLCAQGFFRYGSSCVAFSGPGAKFYRFNHQVCVASIRSLPDPYGYVTCEPFSIPSNPLTEFDDCTNITADYCKPPFRCIEGNCRKNVKRGQRCHGLYTGNVFPHCESGTVCNLGECVPIFSLHKDAPADNALACINGSLNTTSGSCRDDCSVDPAHGDYRCDYGRIVRKYSLKNKVLAEHPESCESGNIDSYGPSFLTRCVPSSEDSCYANSHCNGVARCFKKEINNHDNEGVCKAYEPHYLKEYYDEREICEKKGDDGVSDGCFEEKPITALVKQMCSKFCSGYSDRRFEASDPTNIRFIYDCGAFTRTPITHNSHSHNITSFFNNCEKMTEEGVYSGVGIVVPSLFFVFFIMFSLFFF